MNILQQPFIQVALPIVVTLALAAWGQNKRFDDVIRYIGEVNKRIDEVIVRLGRIEDKLENHNERITRLEERTSLVREAISGLTLPPPGFDKLSPDEKLEYIEALWERIAEHPEDVPVAEWHREVVRERLGAYQSGEMSPRPWSEVREELQNRLRTPR